MTRNTKLKSRVSAITAGLGGIMLLFVVQGPILAYTDWSNFDPGGGGANNAAVCHPTDSNTVWISTDLTGFFRSTNGGKSFSCATSQIQLETVGTGWVRSSLYQLALDPSDPNVCYYSIYSEHVVPKRVRKNGVWKSTDKGSTWSYLDTKYSDSLSLASMVVDYNGNLYCAQPGKIVKEKDGTKTYLPSRNFYVSKDKGATFVKKPPLPFTTAYAPYGHECMDVSRSNWIYITDPAPHSKKAKGMFYSTNQGDSWNAIDSLATKKVAFFACSPQKDSVVVVMTQNGEIWRTEDGRIFVKTFKVSSNPGGWGYHSLGGIDINGKGTVIAWGAHGSRAISHDKGKTFEPLGFRLRNKDQFIFKMNARRYGGCMLAASPVSDHWYLTNDCLSYQSTNNGETWVVRCKGIQIVVTSNYPVVDLTNPNRVHAGAGDVGHYCTPDLGRTWKSTEYSWADISGFAQDPNNPKTFYKIYGWYSKKTPMNRRICKSTDGGATWDSIGMADSLKRKWGRLVVDPTDSKRLYWGRDGINDVLKSENGGKSFVPMPGSPGNVRRLSITKAGNLFGLGNGAWSGTLYKYEKSFNKWHKLHTRISGYAVHPKNELIIFAAVGTHHYNCGSETHGRLEKTTNGGSTWQVIKDANGKDFNPWTLYIDPTNPDLMLMNTFHHFESNGAPSGIMRSLDGGKTWHSINHNHGPSNRVLGFVYGGVKGRAYAWNGIGGGMSRIDNLHVAKFEGKPSIESAGTYLVPMRSSLNVSAFGRISYGIESPSIHNQLVKLGIYDIQGRLVKMLVNQRQSSGGYSINWNGSDGAGKKVSSGIRFYRLEAGDVAQSLKAVMR